MLRCLIFPSCSNSLRLDQRLNQFHGRRDPWTWAVHPGSDQRLPKCFGPKANTHPIGKPQEAEALSECKRRVGVGELPEAPEAPWIQTFWITPAMLPRLPPEHNIHVFFYVLFDLLRDT